MPIIQQPVPKVLSITLSFAELVYFTVKFQSGAHLPTEMRPKLARKRSHRGKQYNIVNEKAPTISNQNSFASEVKEMDNSLKSLKWSQAHSIIIYRYIS